MADNKAIETIIESNPNIADTYHYTPGGLANDIDEPTVGTDAEGRTTYKFPIGDAIARRQAAESAGQFIQPGQQFMVEADGLLTHLSIEEIERRAQSGKPVDHVYWNPENK